jgi:hypothetical protein
VLGLVAGAAAGGWAAGMRIESPADAAARTAAPSPSPILVPVEQRVLSSNVVTRGTAGFGLPQAISVAPSALKGNAAGVITTLPTRYAQIKEGDVLFTTSGRPVFVLQGEVPAYRDLGPGMSGKDVQQLEQALKRLGLDPGPIDGAFDARTSAAVGAWYKLAGHDEFGPTAEQTANLRSLETAREDAARAKISAESAAAGADLALEVARRRANQAEKAAAAELEAIVIERAASLAKPGHAASRSVVDAKIEAARAAVRAARADSEASVHAAVEARKIADFDVQLAAARLERAMAEHEKASSKAGVQVPVDEIVFIPRLPVRVQEISGTIGASASGTAVSVTDNQMTVRSSLPLQAAPLVRAGMEVHIDEPAYGVKTKGVVDHVEQTPGTHGLDGYHVYLAVRMNEPSTRLDGFSLRLTIPVVSTRGAVLAVPLSAVSLGADGASRVALEDDGRVAMVTVEPGLAASGYVEISAVDERLKAGRMVVVGQQRHGETREAVVQHEPRFSLRDLLDGARKAYDSAYELITSALDDQNRSPKEAIGVQ